MIFSVFGFLLEEIVLCFGECFTKVLIGILVDFGFKQGVVEVIYFAKLSDGLVFFVERLDKFVF